VYNDLQFLVPFGIIGDCFDRYLVRVQEMRESLKLIYTCLERLQNSDKVVDNKRLSVSRRDMKLGMEELIYHFKGFSADLYLPSGYGY
jgi:NADH:ubiquinone oxidoreductase subunit D